VVYPPRGEGTTYLRDERHGQPRVLGVFAATGGATRPGIRGHLGEARNKSHGGATQRQRLVVVYNAPRRRPSEYRPFALRFFSRVFVLTVVAW
jgi:hypothetical protein